jgi:hypothetical protein
VDEQQLNRDMYEEGESPVPIPSVDRAWGGMEQLLNTEMPVTSFYGKWMVLKVVASLMIVAVTFNPVNLVNRINQESPDHSEKSENREHQIKSESLKKISSKGKKEKSENHKNQDNQNFSDYPDNPGTAWVYGSSPGFSPTKLDLSTLPLKREDPKALLNKNMQISLPKTAAKPDTSKPKTWSYWVQLNPSVITGEYYATGPNGNNQLYRNILPSVRIKKQLVKSAISADLLPFTSRLLPIPKGSRSPVDANDTGNITTPAKGMVKEFGSGITLQYHYPLSKRWVLSAGAGANYWYKGIAISRDTTRPATKDDWKKYQHLTFTGVAEAYYNGNKWQTGMRTAIPINKTGRPLQLEVLLRRKIR